MNKTLLLALAVAIIVAGGAFATGAAAMTLAPLKATPAAVGEKAANVCGSAGCFTVQTKRVTHPKPLHSSTSASAH